MEPRIQYAQTKDGVSIAFWTLGKGMPLVQWRLSRPWSEAAREAKGTRSAPSNRCSADADLHQ